MSKSDLNQAAWWTGWLEQQREVLKQNAATNSKAASDEPWREAAERYSQALKASSAHRNDPGSFNPFAVGEELLQAWRGTWAAADAARGAAASSLSDLINRLPTLGIAREQAQLWRDLAAAQTECHALEQELRKMLIKVHADALDLVERRLRADKESETGAKSFRDLYDLWVSSAEEIYSALAHSEAFCKLQADLGNATLRLRAGQQKIAEEFLKQFDLPTRSEMNSVHLQLKQLRQRVIELENAQAPASASVKSVKPTRARAKTKSRATR